MFFLGVASFLYSAVLYPFKRASHTDSLLTACRQALHMYEHTLRTNVEIREHCCTKKSKTITATTMNVKRSKSNGNNDRQ